MALTETDTSSITVRDNTSGDTHKIPGDVRVIELATAAQLERETLRNSRSRHQTDALGDAVRCMDAEGGGTDIRPDDSANGAAVPLSSCSVGDWVLVPSDMPGDRPGSVVWWVSEVVRG